MFLLGLDRGHVEVVCKNVVKVRLSCSGMRWSRKGGQNILNIRAHIKSSRCNVAGKNYIVWKNHVAGSAS